MRSKKEIYLIGILILFLFITNYSFLDGKLEDFLNGNELSFVERVVDGDTIKINGASARLLGVNTPEKKEKYYSDAKEFLEKSISNKTVRLEFGKEKYDRYNRILAYVYFNGKNINLELVKNGFANFYFPSGKDSHYEEFVNAWNSCVKSNKNICEKSTNICSYCIELKKLQHKDQEVIFYNKCSFDCDLTSWKIKDEGRKNFIFPEFILNSNSQVKIKATDKENTKETLFWNDETYVWTRTGDTLFLRDNEEKLVLWQNY